MTLRLYDLAGADPNRRFSPYCWRIRLALAHKRLAIETIPWRFTEKAEIAPSGSKTVPVLVDGDRWIADSWTIANYLEDAYPDSPSLFGGAAARRLTRHYSSLADAVSYTHLDVYKRQVEHPDDLGRFVVDDPLCLLVPQRRHRDLASIGRVACDIGLIQIVETVDLIGNAVGVTGVALEGPAVLLEARNRVGDGKDVYKRQT